MKTKSTYKCPFCGKGRMQTQRIDYEIQDTVGERLVIPKLEVDICDRCGQRIFGYEAARKLEEHHRTLDEEINRLLEERLKQAGRWPA